MPVSRSSDHASAKTRLDPALVTGAGIIGFGSIVPPYSQLSSDYSGSNGEAWLPAIGVATIEMGIFCIMITLMAYRRGEKWIWFALRYYPVIWTIYVVFGLPPGHDCVPRVIFIVLSL